MWFGERPSAEPADLNKDVPSLELGDKTRLKKKKSMCQFGALISFCSFINIVFACKDIKSSPSTLGSQKLEWNWPKYFIECVWCIQRCVCVYRSAPRHVLVLFIYCFPRLHWSGLSHGRHFEFYWYLWINVVNRGMPCLCCIRFGFCSWFFFVSFSC